MSIAVTTTKGHVARAISFQARDDVYFKLGKSQTPWNDEQKPPVADPSDEVVEILGYKKAETSLLVVPDTKGTLVYRDEKYRAVTVDKAFDEGARWVYLTSDVSYSELPVDGVYRQIGLSSRVVKNTGVSDSKYALLPSEVKDKGIDEIIDNRKPIYRSDDMKESIVLVVEF